MKKAFLTLSAASLLLMSCGGSKTDESKSGADSTAVAAQTPAVVRMDPAATKPDDVLDAAEANEQINCWNGKEVEPAGYGYAAYRGDSAKIDYGRMSFADKKGGETEILFCNMKDSKAKGAYHKDMMIHVKGTMSGSFGKANLDNCVVVASDPTIETKPVDPFGKAVMDPVAVAADFMKWSGKVVTIKGDYWGTTTSTLKDGNVYRIDIKDGSGNKIANCTMLADPSGKIQTGV